MALAIQLYLFLINNYQQRCSCILLTQGLSIYNNTNIEVLMRRRQA